MSKKEKNQFYRVFITFYQEISLDNFFYRKKLSNFRRRERNFFMKREKKSE